MDKKIMLEIGKKIVVDGFAAKASEDDIKLAMCQAKIPFGKVNAIFTEIAIGENLMVDPKTVAIELADQVSGSQWDSCTDWDCIEGFIAGIIEEMGKKKMDVKRGKVLAAVKAHCKDNEIKLPPQETKPKARAKGGKTANAIVGLFVSNKTPSRDDFYKAVRPVVLGHKNAVDNINMHYLTIYACVNGMTLKEAASATEKSSIMNKEAGIKWAKSQKIEIPEGDLA